MKYFEPVPGTELSVVTGLNYEQLEEIRTICDTIVVEDKLYIANVELEDKAVAIWNAIILS